ncbi:MAG TPA: NADH:ubiquinone reductase (Na(+)-transporting) subunit E, partial [Phycisphaerales bacterium]|nr:NADH:ubiquinone reductase (Na(+)-transporting) subunit E [Phycisphaerales bacterium]
MSETSVFVIIIAAIFTNNILLANFLGMCSFIACSGQIGTALGLGTAVTFVMTMTTMLNYAIYYLVLVKFHLEHLQF